MKELSIEEKARRYDWAIKEAFIAHKDEDKHLKATLERIFPELRESEDERMLNQLHSWMKEFGGAEEYTEKVYLWLKELIEKQGEHDKFRDSIQVGDKVTRNKDGVLVNLSQLKRVAKKDEKQGEQKPVSITDEWIENYWQHEKVNNPYSYDKGEEIQFDHQGFVRFCKKYCKGEQKPTEWHSEDEQNLNACLGFIPDEFLRRWLKDAVHVKYDKPADNVEPKFHEGDMIIHKELGGDYIHNPHKIIQVDILDKKYRLEGGLVAHFCEQDDYELVEQKHKVEWSDEDEKMLDRLLKHFEWTGEYRFDKKDCDEARNWLKSIKDRVQPQPKQEWSEEDEKILDGVITNYESGYLPSAEKRDEIIEKLNSIKERYTWKPSEQDILLLERIANGKSNPQDFQASLGCLIWRLKKLSEK